VELVGAEADDFDVQIIISEAELVPKGDVGVVVFKEGAEDVGELDGHFARELRFEADKRRDGIEGVEEEVRIDLALEGVQTCFEEEMLLLFELHLDAESVPDLEGDADDDGGAEPDENLGPGFFGDQRKELMGEHASQPDAASFCGDDEEKHEELAVDAGAAEDAADPAVEAEVDEGREGPDFIGLDEAAEDSGEEGDGDVEGEREVLGVEHSREREDGSAEGGPARADEEAEEDDGFERDVGGEEVGDGSADPHAEGEGDEKEGEESESLIGMALFREEESAEGGTARENAGYGRHDTQLDQKGDQDETVGHVNSV
jgi:hypothetical protein